jgi:hypothetical protein
MVSDTEISSSNSNSNNGKMDEQFSKMLHAHTQDAWLFKTPLNMICSSGGNIHNHCDFELGFLGCDNAIADRLYKSGYKVINQPLTYKIFHYDIAKGKNSSNFMEKHKQETTLLEVNLKKPKNKYPERKGSYLVPNYDKMLTDNGDVDMINIINSLGGCSNWERYEFICKLFSEKFIMMNP